MIRMGFRKMCSFPAKVIRLEYRKSERKLIAWTLRGAFSINKRHDGTFRARRISA